MRDAGYTIRSMAERCGMTAHTLRYYERVGLIQPVGRARNGHRRYSEADEAWLNFLHCMRATNMSIREMQRYAELREKGDATSLEGANCWRITRPRSPRKLTRCSRPTLCSPTRSPTTRKSKSGFASADAQPASRKRKASSRRRASIRPLFLVALRNRGQNSSESRS